MVITLPELIEQECIVKVLNNVDELIANLENLIEKKKAIKQGTMQELLTGKKRLPGFNGEWKEHTIGKCGYLQKGSINPQTLPDHYFSEYSMPAFDSTRTPSKVQGKTMHSNRTVISGKVLLFNKLNVRQKRIWLIESCENNAVCSAEFLPYSSDTIDLKLLSQILYTDEVTNEFIGMSTGSSNSQKRITPKSFLDYSLFLPTDIEEQKALAEVFSDMDIEIEQLRSKLDKYRLVKQGMMQKLLTGEIRLV
jgi:type I restriction enzyme S subunit